MILLALAAAMAAALALPQVAIGAAPRGNAAPQSMPVGYDEYLVLVANGSWNMFEPHPTVPDCVAMFCDGMYFQETIMGRSPAEIAQKEQEAIEHFRARFGIDVLDPATQERIEFRTWTADPRFNYRVTSWGGRAVPPEGYEVRDGGWAVFITDPDGYTLAGELEGVHVPAGAFAFYGDYNILVTDPSGRPAEEVVLSYRADTFMTFNAFGDMAFSCALSDDEFAAGQTTGYAQGFAHIDVDENGWLNLNIRNVITFGQAALRR